MTLDQTIQVWAAVGTWVAGLATLAAVVVALYLARRSEKIQLKVSVGIRLVVLGDGSGAREHVCFGVTNIGERPVTINSVGWRVGKGKKRRYCIQTLSGPFTKQYPIELSHGKNASFMVSLSATPSWVKDFAEGFVEDLSDRSLKTLIAQVHTSVGQTIEVRPEDGLIRRLREHGTSAAA